MLRNHAQAGLIAFIRTRVAAAKQRPDQTFHRIPGNRALTGPFCAKIDAEEEWQFALLSAAAYGRSLHSQTNDQPRRGFLKRMWRARAARKRSTATLDADAELQARGWRPWQAFPDAKLAALMKISHLRAEVWEQPERDMIVVAFGGTVFTSGKDWLSNLRWFLPHHNDEYTTIVKRFAPDFVKAFSAGISAGSSSANSTIYATGHSLGGGLAQQFAYCLPETATKKVAAVYAFDPSPVTGFYSVGRDKRNYNRKGLKIIRSYERGEVLATLRSLTSLFNKPCAINPEIAGVRFSLFYTLNPLSGHSIDELAAKMKIAALAGSPIRY